MSSLGSFSNQTATAKSQEESLDLEFIFSPDSDSALGGGPHPLRGKHKPYRNPNRPGTPLAFWRNVKDVLRRMTFHERRGAYTAPGNGKRNNIERDPFPTGAGSPPVLHGGGIAQMRPRRARLDVPPLPPFELPVLDEQLATAQSTVPAERLPIIHHSAPIPFRGFTLTPEKPISYSQEVHFIENTATFINRSEAQRVMSSLLALMQAHSDVHVHIIGNAASDFRAPALGYPYGHNKALLMKFPAGGIYDGVPSYGAPYRTIGALMLARAQAIGNLLISKGIARNRVHCSIGTLGYGDTSIPGSGARKRRATIVISQKP